MSTQKAVVLTELHKPVTLTTTHPIPQPSANQIQIKVTIAGLNPHDEKSQSWGLFVEGKLPAVLAADVVGIVSKLGPDVTKFAVGDRVVSHASFVDPATAQNGLQEYAVADTFAAAKIPDSISDDQAATLPTNIIAPLVALFAELKIPAPWTEAAKTFDYAAQTVLIVGGGSSTGKYGVQLAKIAGIGRIIVVGGKEDELKKFGATHVLDRHAEQDDLVKQIRDITGDDLVYAYDSVNGVEGQILAVKALSNEKKGGLARLLPMGPIDASKAPGKKAGFDTHDVYGSSHGHVELCTAFWEHVREYLTSGKITTLGFTVKKGLTAENANEILDAYREGKPITKTHIHF